MNKFLLLIIVFFTVSAVLAQTPFQFKYQAVLREPNGNIISSQPKTIVVNILQGSVTGNIVFTETHNATTTAQGIINLNIGSINTTDLEKIDWAANTYFIKITVAGIEMGTSQLLSVPYALNAKKAETADYTKLSNLPQLNIANWNTAYSWGNHAGLYRPVSYTPAWNDITGKPTTISGYGITDAFNGSWTNITGKPTTISGYGITDAFNGDMKNQKITNVATPTADQDAANKAYVDVLKQQLKALEEKLGYIRDIDGNIYRSVKIGTQYWLGENLKTTKYNDGTPIPNVKETAAWAALTTPAYCSYDNTTSNFDTYGGLYNWYSIDATSNGGKNICPVGWHIPSETEWNTLYVYASGATTGGNKLKATIGWGGTGSDMYGFTALAAGYRYSDGTSPNNIGMGARWWSATTASGDATKAVNIFLYNTDAFIYWNNTTYTYNKNGAFSVRCIKD